MTLKNFGRFTAIAVFMLCLGTEALAQNVRSLFEIDQTVQYRPAADEYERTGIQLNESIRQHPPVAGDILTMPVGGQTLEFRVVRVSEYIPGIISVTGRDAGNSGRYMAFTFAEDHMTGLMQLLPESQVYHFSTEPETSGHVMARVRPDMLDLLACGVDDSIKQYTLEPDHPFELARQKIAPGVQAPKAGPEWQGVTLGSEDVVTIDIMMVYTNNARNWANSNSPGSIESAIAQALNLSQQALDNSETNIELRLVRSHFTSYSDDVQFNPTLSGGDHLRRLTASPNFNPFGGSFAGYMEEVHTIRDEVGADFVAMLAFVQDVGGIAWLNSGYSGNPDLAFSVNRIQQTHTGYTLVHEIGHNMGKAHGRIQASNAASPFGAMHMYSVGWQFEPENPSSFADPNRPIRTTVMQYAIVEEGQLRSIDYPGFSNPEVTAEGTATGFSTGLAQANNARSLRDIKGVASSYRPAKFEPPVLPLSGTPLQATVDSGNTASFPLSLSNTGESNLMWSLDVALPQNTTSNATRALNLPVEDVLHETGYESSDGWITSSFFIFNDYRTFNTQRPFQISTANPADGARHLRMPYSANADAETFLQVSLPLYDRGMPGGYTLEFDMDVARTTDSEYQVRVNDATRGGTAGGFAISSSGNLFLHNGGSGFVSAGLVIEGGSYNRYRVTLDSDTGYLYYFLNDELLQAIPLTRSISFDHVQLLRRNTANTNDYLDLDNLSLVRHYTGRSWITSDVRSGSLLPDESGTVNVELLTEGLTGGIHQATVLLRTNDPDNAVVEFPVTLNVTGTVSVEQDGVLPYELSLSQNYPNPFNPTTNINFTLPDAGAATLRVFDVTGRLVATLVNETMPAGQHSVTFDAGQLASGMYLYRLETSAGVRTQKMTLIK